MARGKNGELQRLNKLYAYFHKAAREMAGYPVRHLFNYSRLFRFLKFHINNVGDPFQKLGYFRVNTLEFEREVIDRVAELFHAPKNGYWGYVTNGGTEGNLYGLYAGRELYPEGIVYYSDQTHYSIPKCLRILRMQAIEVKSQSNGEINYRALQCHLMAEKKALGRPPIIMANIGTTMKGAVDDIVRIKEILSDLKIEEYYIHCDAAFFGMILPFLPDIESQPFDFRIGIDSISISGHKMIGTPFPCGVFLSQKSNLDKISAHVEYLAIKDNTLTGSRNGISPLCLWLEINCSKEGKFEKIVRECMERASYAVNKFNEIGIKAWRNKNSFIVIFPRPSEKTVRKWQLAVHGDIAHLITLPHVSHRAIDTVIKQVSSDLKKTKRSRKELPTVIP